MLKGVFGLLAIVGLASIAFGGCGDVDSSSTNDYPQFSLTFPSAVTDSSTGVSSRISPWDWLISKADAATLTTTQSRGMNLMTQSIQRIDRILSRADTIFSKLNTSYSKSKITWPGTFSFTSAGGDAISGTVSSLSDETYSYEVKLCKGSSLFWLARWNASQTQVYVYRDHSVEPLALADSSYQTSMKTEVVFTKDTLGQMDVTWKAYGQPWKVPGDVTDGPYLAESGNFVRTTFEQFTFKVVHAWETSASSGGKGFSEADGDAYFTGAIGLGGAASFVGFRKYNSTCGTQLNEASPTWCFYGSVDSSGATFSTDSASSAWSSQFQSTGIQKASTLKVVQAPTDVACS